MNALLEALLKRQRLASDAPQHHSVPQRVLYSPSFWSTGLALLYAPTFGLIPRWQLIHLSNWSSVEGMAKCAELTDSLLVTTCSWTGFPIGGFIFENIATKTGAYWLHVVTPLSAFDAWQVLGIVYIALGIRGIFGITNIATGSHWPGFIAALMYFSGSGVDSSPGLNQVLHGSALLPFFLWLFLRTVRSQSAWPKKSLKIFFLTFSCGILLVNIWGYAFLFFAVIALLFVTTINFVDGITALRQQAFSRFTAFEMVLFPVAAILGFFAVSTTQKKVWPSGGVSVSDIRFLRGTSNDVLGVFAPNKNNVLWSRIFDLSETIGVDSRYGKFGPFLGFIALVLIVILLFKSIKSLRIDTKPSENVTVSLALLTALLATVVISLGPSLRISDPWPANGPFTNYNSRLMPADSATFSLPWAAVFKSWGLGVARVVGRWSIATSLLVAILSAVVSESFWRYSNSRFSPHSLKNLLKNLTSILALSCLLILETTRPLISSEWRTYANRREWIAAYQEGVLTPLNDALPFQTLTLHLPTANDYLSSSVGPYSELQIFNVGGDKNRALVKEQWPAEILRAANTYKSIDPEADQNFEELSGQAQAVYSALLSGEVEAIVLNHFSLRTASYGFPPAKNHLTKWRETADFTSLELTELCSIQQLPYAALVTDCE